MAELDPGSDDETVTLYRPVGEKELELIRDGGYARFPPRLEWQPIFYPVLSEDYATEIAKNWNTKDARSGFVGHVLRFRVRAGFLKDFEVHRVGGRGHDEYWIPAAQLDEFNDNIVGDIEVIATFRDSDV